MKTILKFEEFISTEHVISIAASHHTVVAYTRDGKLYALKPTSQNEAAEEQIKYELLAAMRVAAPETHVVKDISGHYFIASEIISDAIELGCIVYKHICAEKTISLGRFAEAANDRLKERGLLYTPIVIPEEKKALRLPIVGLYENLAPFLFIGDTAPVGRTRPLGPAPRGTYIPGWHFFSNMLIALRGDKILCYKIDPDGTFCSRADEIALQEKEKWLVKKGLLVSRANQFSSDGDHLYGIFELTNDAEALHGLKRVATLSPEKIMSIVSEGWEYDGSRIALLAPERVTSIITKLLETQNRMQSYYDQLVHRPAAFSQKEEPEKTESQDSSSILPAA